MLCANTLNVIAMRILLALLIVFAGFHATLASSHARLPAGTAMWSASEMLPAPEMMPANDHAMIGCCGGEHRTGDAAADCIFICAIAVDPVRFEFAAPRHHPAPRHHVAPLPMMLFPPFRPPVTV